jgi:MFS transporter, ACS family, hexuronate transporter
MNIAARRWWIAALFYLSSTLNYLDRQILTTLAPIVQREFSLNNEQYGGILSSFSLVYAICSPLMGRMIDRLGLNVGTCLAVACWSIAGMARGWTDSLAGLQWATLALAAAEAAGIPATARFAQAYLKPEERALGSALSQIGLSIGAIAATRMAATFGASNDWRSAFFLCGALGFLWIPLWLIVARRAPAVQAAPVPGDAPVGELLRDPRMIGLFIANVFAMLPYTLWTNWTTILFTKTYGLDIKAASYFAGWPPFIAYFGSLLGGGLSMWLIRRGTEATLARRMVCLGAACGILLTFFVPWAATPWMATLLISASFFFASAWGVNLYVLPLDLFGQRYAAFAVSLLTASYGLLQFLVSRSIGRTVDQFGFGRVCAVAAVSPLVAWCIIESAHRWSRSATRA